MFTPQGLDGIYRGLTSGRIAEAKDHDRSARRSVLDAEDVREAEYEMMGVPRPEHPGRQPAAPRRSFFSRLFRRR